MKSKSDERNVFQMCVNCLVLLVLAIHTTDNGTMTQPVVHVKSLTSEDVKGMPTGSIQKKSAEADV